MDGGGVCEDDTDDQGVAGGSDGIANRTKTEHDEPLVIITISEKAGERCHGGKKMYTIEAAAMGLTMLP